MRYAKENRSTLVFIGFLALAGCANLLTRTEDLFFNSVMFTVNVAIYVGLLLFWMQSVRRRLLPTRARGYMLLTSFLMLLYLLLRVYKYRIANTAVLTRCAAYLYYVPMMLIPAFFLMTSLYIRRGERRGPGKEALLLLPAAALSLTVLTNDLHELVYVPQVPLAEFAVNTGTYSYGPGFYLLYIWMILAVLAGVVLLSSATRKKTARGLFMLSAVLLIWFGMALLSERIFNRLDLIRPYSSPEIHIFGMLGVFEVCIRSRLLPHNENYSGFFQSMHIPALITDRSLAPVFETVEPLTADTEALRRSLSSAVYPAEDIRLNGKAIQAGCVFWTTDERELRRMNERLEDANETLDTENTLIEAENRQREELARMEFRSRIDRQISEELYPVHKKLERLLDGMWPGADSYRRDMQLACVLNAYVKRATNLMLMAAENRTVASRELLLALQESVRYLRCCGVKAEGTGTLDGPLPSERVFPLYKTFEALLPEITYLTATLSPEGLRLAADSGTLPPLPDTPLPVSAFLDDGMLYLSIAPEKGGRGMTTLHTLAGSPGGRLLALCAVLLMTGQLFVCLQAQRQRRSKRLVLLHLLHACVGIALTACLLDGIYHLLGADMPSASVAPVVRRLFALPWGAVAAAELLSAGLLALSYRNNRRFARSHLLPSSIKEALDRLPDGICFGDASGAVVLSNLRMNALCRALFGVRLTDTNAFWQELCARGEDQNGQKLLKTADGEALLFQQSEIAVDGRAYTQLVASDVTAQYRITEELARKNARLRDIQLRMKAYQAQAADIVISQEILNARQLVHDEVGHALLAARYYFEHPESGDETVLLAMMKRTNTMLLREAELPDDLERDRYRDALKMARAIGVTVEQTGTAPEAGPVRELLGQAVGECAANAAKHAEGDRLFVTVREAEDGVSFTVTNNGLPPKEPIVETGGLLALRRAVEKAGGDMTVEHAPAFRLKISLPKQ